MRSATSGTGRSASPVSRSAACGSPASARPGWEITCPSDRADTVYEALHEAGARPCGVLAQTSMRIEKRFLAYGHDIDTDVTPPAAGLEFAIGRSKDFVGRDALSRLEGKPPGQRIASIVLDDEEALPLGGEPVRLGERIVGKTTSAAFGYRNRETRRPGHDRRGIPGRRTGVSRGHRHRRVPRSRCVLLRTRI